MADPIWGMIKYHEISNVFFWLEISHSGVFGVGNHESELDFANSENSRWRIQYGG